MRPANDTMLAIVSLLAETLMYGFVIMLMVTVLLYITVDTYCIDNPALSESAILPFSHIS